METVVLILMGLAVLSFLLKLTFHGRAGLTALSLVAALSVLLTTDTAASQSKTQIADWLAQPGLMLDTSVLLTLDVALQLGFCLLAARRACGPTSLREARLHTLCLWFPGLLVLPVLLAAQTELIFSLPGTYFRTIGRSAAAAVALALPALALALKSLLPEDDLRLELLFMLGLIIAAAGIVATVNGRTAAVGPNRADWPALAGVAGLLAAGALLGFLFHHYHNRKQIQKLQ